MSYHFNHGVCISTLCFSCVELLELFIQYYDGFTQRNFFLMEQCYTTVHLLTNYQRYFSLNLRCMTFFLLQHHSNAVLIDFHYYIYPKFNICTLFSVFVSDNTANRFCTVPSKNSNDLLLGGQAGMSIF